jgi:hypothetical protein
MVMGRRCRGGEKDECANEMRGGVDMGSGEHEVRVDGRGGGGRDGCGREEHVWMQPQGQAPQALFMVAGWGLSNQAAWVVRRGERCRPGGTHPRYSRSGSREAWEEEEEGEQEKNVGCLDLWLCFRFLT